MRTSPVRSLTIQRAASAAPTKTASASLGRNTGSTVPRSIPAVSGVKKIIRYAATAGRANTHAPMASPATTTSAASGLRPSSAPTPAQNSSSVAVADDDRGCGPAGERTRTRRGARPAAGRPAFCRSESVIQPSSGARSQACAPT